MKTCDHKSVGMIIRNGEKILLIERGRPPYGFAPPAGHVDEKGSFENAAREETMEEVGLKVIDLKQVAAGRKENRCRRDGGTWHYWKIYEVTTSGEISRNLDETKQAGWYSTKQIKSLAEKTKKYLSGNIPEEEWQKSPGLELAWFDWLTQLKII